MAQRLLAVFCSPTPLRKDRPKRHVSEEHNGCAARARFQIICQPLQLFLAEHSQATFFDIHDIYQTDEMDTFLIEAVPTRASRTLAKSLEILLSIIIQDVMLARHVENLLGFAAFQDLFERVELLGLGKMREVARMKHEGRGVGQGINL